MRALVIDSSVTNRDHIISLLRSVHNIGIISQAEDKEMAEQMIDDLQSDLIVLNTCVPQQQGARVNSIALLKDQTLQSVDRCGHDRRFTAHSQSERLLDAGRRVLY
jgi:chemotaxis response regulator CheB